MGAIKIGEAELFVIRRIEQIKEEHKVRVDGALKGLRIIENQIFDSKDKSIKGIKTQVEEIIKRAEYLNYAIQEIKFSEEYDEDKFFVVWGERDDITGSYCERGFGKAISKEPVSEKQFVFALAAWEREVCKRLAKFKEFERFSYDSLFPTLEVDIHKMLYEYVIKN